MNTTSLALAEPDKNPALLYLLTLTTKASREGQRQVLTTFVRFALPGSTLATFPWHEVGPEHLLLYRDVLIERVKRRTTNRYVGAVKSVSKMAWILGLIDAERLAKIQQVQKIKGANPKSGRDLTTCEIRKLIDCTQQAYRRWNRVRNEAIVTLFYATGMRRFELANLTLEDLTRYDNHAEFRVFGKGHKERRIPFSLAFIPALEKWLNIRGRAPGPFFTRSHSLDRLSPKAVGVVIVNLAQRADIGRATPHDFRRTFAGRLIDAGVDLSAIAQMMGHENVETTAGYDRRGERAILAAASKLPSL